MICHMHPPKNILVRATRREVCNRGRSTITITLYQVKSLLFSSTTRYYLIQWLAFMFFYFKGCVFVDSVCCLFRSRFAFTLESVGVHLDLFSISLRFHCLSPRCNFDVTLRVQVQVTSISKGETKSSAWKKVRGTESFIIFQIEFQLATRPRACASMCERNGTISQ